MVTGEALSNKRKRIDLEFWLAGLFSLVIFGAVIYLLVFHLQVFLTDSMARTRSAWQVFLSNEPKLENVGFVWAPLPTLLQVPLVWIAALRYKGISGNIVTALCGAGSVQVLLLFLRQTRLPVVPRWLLLLVYIFNPMILFYAANGMSEMVLILFVLLTAYFYLRWNQTKRWKYLSACGMATSMAFLARYDASFMAVVITLFIGIGGFVLKRRNLAYAESLLLLYAVPVAYITGLWVFLNWIIMGDPLYFMRSDYSNAGQIGYQLAMLPELIPLKYNALATLTIGFRETFILFPVSILATVWLAVKAVFRKAWVWLGILAIAWSLTLFSVFNLFMGQSALFIRYFIAAIPMGMVIIVGVLMLYPPRWQSPLAILLVLMTAVSGVFTAEAMRSHKEWGQWNDKVVEAVLTDTPLNSWKEEQTLAQYVKEKTTGFVLMDDFQGYRVIFFTGEPWRFITPADSIFKQYLKYPFQNVSYLLTSSTALEGELNQVNNAYPYLFEKGGGWVKLVYQDSTWKLFRVIDKPDTLQVDQLQAQAAPLP